MKATQIALPYTSSFQSFQTAVTAPLREQITATTSFVYRNISEAALTICLFPQKMKTGSEIRLNKKQGIHVQNQHEWQVGSGRGKNTIYKDYGRVTGVILIMQSCYTLDLCLHKSSSWKHSTDSHLFRPPVGNAA